MELPFPAGEIGVIFIYRCGHAERICRDEEPDVPKT